ncbi:MAG: citrate synthase [Alphaproteobacteria bacterium]|nr:citrate synthase [Alphaproteobacteria bacterium]
MTTWIAAPEALRLLGVKRATLYTYASRGWVATRRLDGRRKLYRRADVERLRDRSLAHQGSGARSAATMAWGEPILETAITGIDRDGPYYRGVPAVDLVDTPLEAVAELLWGVPPGSWPMGTTAPDLPTLDGLRRHVDGLPRLADPLDQARQLVVEVRAASGLPAHPDLTAAAVLCADHDLTASTFTARVVASTGADLYAVVVAALAAFSGPRHGAASQALAALLAAPAALERALRDGRAPGFGHPLYPDGDPRAVVLLERTPPTGALARAIERFAAIGVAPNLDAGLAALCAAHGLPPRAGSLVFATGRVAGWIAHALEQRSVGGLLRPRAHYTGWDR